MVSSQPMETLQGWDVPVEQALAESENIGPALRAGQLYRWVVRPSFEPTVSYAWLRRPPVTTVPGPGDEPDFVRRVTWGRVHSTARAVRSTSGRFHYDMPEDISVIDAPLPIGSEALLDELHGMAVPLDTRGPFGCDGTSYDVYLGRLFHSVRLSYWLGGPDAWQPVVALVQRIGERMAHACAEAERR